MAKNQILAVQIHTATYLVFYVYDRTSTLLTVLLRKLHHARPVLGFETGPVWSANSKNYLSLVSSTT